MTTEATPRSRRRVVLARTLTVLAALLVLVALVIPDEIGHVTPAGFLAIPLEALLGVVILLALPPRARGIAALGAGAALGLLTILKLLDLGFGFALDRPFDPLSDWPLIRSGQEFLAESFGRTGAAAAAIGVGLLALALPVLMALAVRRLSRVAGHRPVPARRAVLAVGTVWVVLAAFGVHLVPGVPVAAWNTSAAAYDHTTQLRADLADRAAFARESAVDAYRDTPGDQLLTGLRGNDVIVAFVESYGRVALEDPRIAPQVDAALADGDRGLAKAGYSARSAYLTSPTAGGASWLAHSTFQSGLWVDSQRRYQDFTGSDRFTLTGAFGRAGWRTVDVLPANRRDWPEGDVYGYDRIYDARNLGYKGPYFSFGTIPDQYSLAAFHRAERATPGHPPVMAEFDMVSSHAPWEPVPALVDWAGIGDGSGLDGLAGAGDSPNEVFEREIDRVRDDFARSIAYSVRTLVSYVETYGGDNLVLVMLGDHQPAPIISGTGARAEVPVTVVARDPAVLDRIAGWGWQDGLRPDPRAPVWPMDGFRDRFLATFGPQR
jgi:hypothetical protein